MRPRGAAIHVGDGGSRTANPGAGVGCRRRRASIAPRRAGEGEQVLPRGHHPVPELGAELSTLAPSATSLTPGDHSGLRRVRRSRTSIHPISSAHAVNPCVVRKPEHLQLGVEARFEPPEQLRDPVGDDKRWLDCSAPIGRASRRGPPTKPPTGRPVEAGPGPPAVLQRRRGEPSASVCRSDLDIECLACVRHPVRATRRWSSRVAAAGRCNGR